MRFTDLDKKETFEAAMELPAWAKPLEAKFKDEYFVDDLIADMKESIQKKRAAMRESIEDGEDIVSEFETLVDQYEEYIGANFYNEKCDSAEKISRVDNTIQDLKAKFTDYEDACEDKERVALYCEKMYSVIDSLTDFMNEGDEE